MRAYIGSLLVAFVTALLIPISTSAKTPTEESVCVGLSGAAFGLCNAYCEAMDCDSEAPNANETACLKVLSDFTKHSDELIPCGRRKHRGSTYHSMSKYDTRLAKRQAENSTTGRLWKKRRSRNAINGAPFHPCFREVFVLFASDTMLSQKKHAFPNGKTKASPTPLRARR